jgi:hypothetical protein
MERLAHNLFNHVCLLHYVLPLQVYRDIPLPSWQVVCPDKLLQFRPPDLLRLDLFGLAGATAVLAQLQAINPTHHSLILFCYEKLSAPRCYHVCLLHYVLPLQVYRDIPLPSWQVVFPDKLLQFRPLDLLRLDLFGLAGAGAVLAQAKYSSLILELVSLVSLSVWGTRMVLGYMRMGDRWVVHV